jgi:hypothetical protein
MQRIHTLCEKNTKCSVMSAAKQWILLEENCLESVITTKMLLLASLFVAALRKHMFWEITASF